jgi:hypothetical protein
VGMPGNIPIPDPSLLTTEQLRRELAGLREVLETRLDGMDVATHAVTASQAREAETARVTGQYILADLERRLAALREILTGRIEQVTEVTAERFSAVAARFTERDTRTEETAQQSRISLDAALAAAKEAVSEQNKANATAIGKSEAATQKQIDAMIVNMGTSFKALEDKINDMKARLDTIAGKTQGGTNMWGFIVGAAGLIISAVLFVKVLTGK